MNAHLARRRNAAEGILWALTFALIFAASWAFDGTDPVELIQAVQSVIVQTWDAIVGAVDFVITHTTSSAKITL